MATLSEFLGYLLSEVTRARVHADMEATRIAEGYAAHPLLRNLSVPRFRIPDLTVDVPVVINTIEAQAEAKPLDPSAVRDAFGEVLNAEVRSAKIKLAKKTARKIDDAIAQAARPADTAAINLVDAADSFVKEAMSQIRRGKRDEGAMRRLETNLRAATRKKFAGLRPPGPALAILVTGGELQSAPPSSITRFKLTIHEQNVEWTTTEADGETSHRLVPE